MSIVTTKKTSQMKKYYAFFASLWLFVLAIGGYQWAITMQINIDTATAKSIAYELENANKTLYSFPTDYRSDADKKRANPVMINRLDDGRSVACAVFKRKIGSNGFNNYYGNETKLVADQKILDEITSVFGSAPDQAATVPQSSEYYVTNMSRPAGYNCYLYEKTELR
jgi:hypothetical protein